MIRLLRSIGGVPCPFIAVTQLMSVFVHRLFGRRSTSIYPLQLMPRCTARCGIFVFHEYRTKSSSEAGHGAYCPWPLCFQEVNMMQIRNTSQERIRSIVASINRKELRPWEKRIVAEVFGICQAVAGVLARYAKGPELSCSITIPCEIAV